MKQSGFQSNKGHVSEHQAMLKKLNEINHKISHDDWKKNDIQEFMDKWGKHIINSDMTLNTFLKTQDLESIL